MFRGDIPFVTDCTVEVVRYALIQILTLLVRWKSGIAGTALRQAVQRSSAETSITSLTDFGIYRSME